jgi:S-adenosyl methyltransferase
MTEHDAEGGDPGPFAIDLSVAHVARFENVVAGGRAHFAVDRAAVDSVCELASGGLGTLRMQVEALNGFVARSVTLLTAQHGIRQFLDVGMMIPGAGMLHEVAARVAPGVRVVYASHDVTTLAHAHAIDDGTPGAAVAHVHQRYDDPEAVLHAAAATLDFDRPMAVVLPATLSLVPDDAVAQRVVDTLCRAVAPGSYLVLAHVSFDDAPAGSEKVLARFNQIVEQPYVVRTRAQILPLLAGVELLEPGLVPLDRWRLDEADAPPPGTPRPPMLVYGAVGRKPS